MNARAEVRMPWNKDKLIGQKSPLKLKEIWTIRIRLQAFRQGQRPGAFQFGDR
jgi:hypothetical protein